MPPRRALRGSKAGASASQKALRPARVTMTFLVEAVDAAWLEEQAFRLDRSKSWVVRDALRRARKEQS